MAAIYSGIHLKLKSSRTPWEEKLKLARFAWISQQCFLPNKEQVLVDWVSHVLTGYYGKKLDLQQNLVEGLWAYLDDILHSKKLQNLLNQGKTLSLRFAVAQIINERISACASGTSLDISTALSCCHGILSSSMLSVIYATKYELMVELLNRLCQLASVQLRLQGPEQPLKRQVFEVLLLALNSYLQVQKQQSNPNRVFAQVTAHLLQPFLLLRHFLTSRNWTAEDDPAIRHHLSKDIRAKVDAVLQSALFVTEHLQSYKEELLRVKEGPGTKKAPVTKALLSPVSTILAKLTDTKSCDPALRFALRVNSIPVLFRFALEAFCKGPENKVVGFHMLTRFFPTLGFSEELAKKELSSPGNWSMALLALENLLNLSLSWDLYNVAADRFQHGEAQFQFYREVAELLSNHSQPTIPAWYRCLKALFALNHLIVEPDLDGLVSSAWIDADCVEPRVMKAREALLAVLLQTYAKLRQLPRLFEEVLTVICRPAADELRQPVLSAGLSRNLSQCLLDIPPSQSLEICSLILEKCRSFLLPDLEGQDDLALKLLSLSVLLHAVLFNVKSMDNSTPPPVVKRSQCIMGELLAVIKSLLDLLQGPFTDALWFKKTAEGALLLTYTWVEVDTLFQMHCSKYVSQVRPESQSSHLEGGTSFLPGVKEEDWNVILSKATQCGSLGQLLQELLALQKMKQILLKMDFVSNASSEETLRSTAGFILRSGKSALSQTNTDQWYGEIGNVDVNTYPVAHWFLVTSNLALISPYLCEEDLSHIASVLLSSVLHKGVVDGAEDQGTCLSVPLISRHLLGDIMLIELPSLYSAFIRSLSQRIVGILRGSNQGPLSQVLLRFVQASGATVRSEEEGSETTSKMNDASPAWKRLESIAREVLISSNACTAISLPKSQLESLMNLLPVTRALNPDGMSPEDHSECFLLLFFTATNVRPSCDTESTKTLELLKEVYVLLASLLSGRNMGSVLKVVHGSDLLEAAMTSLFSLSDRGVSEAVDSSTWLAFLQAVQQFLRGLIQVIINRRKSVRLNLEKFTSFMVTSDMAASILSREKLGTRKPGSVQLLLASLTTLCKAMIVDHSSSKLLESTMTGLLEKAIATMGPLIQNVLKSQSCGLLGQSFSVNVVTVLLEAELAQSSSKPPEAGSLRYIGLYRGFTQQILRELSSSPRPMDFLHSALCFLQAFYSAAEKTKEPGLDELFIAVVQSLKKLLAAPWISAGEIHELEDPLSKLLAQLVTNSTREQFHVILMSLKDGLGSAWLWSGRHGEVLSAVTLTRLVVLSPLNDLSSKAFWFMAPQIITNLVFIVKESSKEVSLTAGFTVPVLEALRAVLRQGEGRLSNPHHVAMVYGALQSVPLEHLSVEDYYTAFQAIHEVLFAVIQCHPKVMLKAAPSFLNCFYRLVVSIMHEGRQKGEGEKGSDAEFEVLLKCAQLVERMYTHIATAAEDFTVLSSFIVAQYVSELQKVTLYPQIKRHLTEGVYKILDLCFEQDVKFLNTALQMGVKEVFNELFANYTRYHKTQRQGEEKYTA
ncbi:unhealthy ribosome biogenesis protein 2 homolog isoform X2 [Amia ocellicauda]|uniref:unhealthy ribosome biogenesis protein 2 homolog isoform X2 n=1 Tax=Amia ocellicauda TaxID=2972642 RepID=UPI003464A359